jgi:CheY-like chemotaxis protein/nitrogen-specific signal transduction histidine kinase/HPt (histidine-containing phosphotransfer) domain-containing protein
MTFLAASEDPASSFYIFLRDIWAGKRGDSALIRAKDAAEASNRAKSEFLAKISHDIRTPLNAILGAADLLSQTPLSSDQNEYVSMFQRNCRRLVALINDFLDFSRIEAGAVRVEKAPCRIRETVDDAVATFRDAAARKGIALGVEIDPEVPAWVLGDPLRIQQVMVNLLSNALKFTSAGRVDVKVTVLSAASAGDRLGFEVCDTGPGIRLEDQDKIFARFVQLSNQSNGQRGTGLGLTICRDLVELMGGEIGVVSRASSGSTFHFSLPLEEVSAPGDSVPAESRPAELHSGDPIRILVAEDTEDNRLLLEHYLRDEPVKLRIALNGQEALDAVRQGEQFDMILMDIDMPVMDGLTATKRIREWQQSQVRREPERALTPVVALSADAMREAVAASMEAGCVAHVAKPMDRETLMKTIYRFAPAKAAPAARTIAISEQVMALVPQYLASKEKQIEEARAALASRDFGPIRRFGHNLKGTGRGYGFPSIEDMGREIERAATQADASRIAVQLDALHRFVTESAAALTRS